jgi:hypothetical protein
MNKKTLFIWGIVGTFIVIALSSCLIQKNQTKDLVQKFADTLSTNGIEATYPLMGVRVPEAAAPLMAPDEYSLDYPYDKSYALPIWTTWAIPPQDRVEITLLETREITPAMQANGLSRVEIWCASFLAQVNGEYEDWFIDIWVVIWNKQTFILKVTDNLFPCH